MMFLLLCGRNKDAGSNSDNEDDNNLAGNTNADNASPGSNPGSCPPGWFFPGFMFFMHFGPSAGNIASNRFLNPLMIKDPPAAAKKEFSWSAKKKRVTARESSACEVDPQRGPTSKDVIRQEKLQIKEASTELQKRTFFEKLKEQRDHWQSDKASEREKHPSDEVGERGGAVQ